MLSSYLENRESGSGKILKEAEANSEATNFIRSRKQKIPRVRKWTQKQDT